MKIEEMRSAPVPYFETKEEGKEGMAYLWCPFCLTEWEEELPASWDDRTAYYWEICPGCYEAGHRDDEINPEFWAELMRKHFPPPPPPWKPPPPPPRKQAELLDFC